MPVSNKQRVFLAEYQKDHNGTQAAIRAGYPARSAHVMASRILKSEPAKELMRQYNDDAFDSLHKVATTGKSEMARVVAADKILNRTHDMPYNRDTDARTPNITIQVNKLSDLTK